MHNSFFYTKAFVIHCKYSLQGKLVPNYVKSVRGSNDYKRLTNLSYKFRCHASFYAQNKMHNSFIKYGNTVKTL